MKLRVLVVDDEPLARERLAHLVEEMPDAELAGIAASGEQALLLAGSLRPQVILQIGRASCRERVYVTV